MFDIKNVLVPKTLNEAIEMYNNNPRLKIIAGGTDVLIGLHHGKLAGVELLSLRDIPGLNEIKLLDDGVISIGAMCTFSQISRNELIKKFIPLLASASISMGGPQIRNIATIGGNICNGAVSADSAPSLFVLNALLQLRSSHGVRMIPIQDFYEGPGKVKLLEGEILTDIIITKDNYQDMHGKYIKFSNRKAMDIAMLSVSVLLKINNHKFSDLRIALGVSGPTPVRCTEAEKFSIDKEINQENIESISKLALNDATPRNSWRASKEYRLHLIQVLTERAIKDIALELGVNINE